MLVAEIHLDHPALRTPLEQIPGVNLWWERSDIVDGDTLRLLVWVPTEHCSEWEDALEAEPTITDARCITALDDRNLYRIDQQGEEIKPEVYQQFVEEGSVIRNATVSHEGWVVQATYSNRESLSRFLRFCEERDVGFEVRRILSEGSGPAATGKYGLTPQQQEILEAAAELGYFDIPRSASLAEVGDALGISGNAASERLRRGMSSLLQQTVLDGSDDRHP